MTDAPTCPYCDGKGVPAKLRKIVVVSWSDVTLMCGGSMTALGFWFLVLGTPPAWALMIVGGIMWLVGMAMRKDRR